MDTEKIKANMAARKLAESVTEWVEIHAENDQQKSPRMWEEIIRIAKEKLEAMGGQIKIDKHGTIEPMSETEAQVFENSIVPWGKYKDEKIKDVDLSYLAWLADCASYSRQIQRYLKSPKLQREMRDGS